MVAWPVLRPPPPGPTVSSWSSRRARTSTAQCCPTARAPRSSRSPTAPAARWPPPTSELGDGPVVVLSGDVPLVTAGALRALVRAHREAGAAATMVTTILDDPSGYGRVVRARRRHASSASSRPRPPATRRRRSSRSARSTPASTASTPPRCARRSPRVGTDNAQGERYLPEVLPLLRADGLTVAAHVVDDPALVLGINDRVRARRGRAPGPRPHPRRPHARRRHDRRPAPVDASTRR